MASSTSRSPIRHRSTDAAWGSAYASADSGWRRSTISTPVRSSTAVAPGRSDVSRYQANSLPWYLPTPKCQPAAASRGTRAGRRPGFGLRRHTSTPPPRMRRTRRTARYPRQRQPRSSRMPATDATAPMCDAYSAPAALSRTWARAPAAAPSGSDSSARSRAALARATSISSPISADSASIVTFSGVTCRNPPCTATVVGGPSTPSMRTTPASSSCASVCSWPGRMPISPTVVRAKTKLALPDQTRRSTATSSTVISAILVAFQLLPVALQVLETAAEEERLLRHVVELALGDLVERLDRLLERHRGARLAGELLGHQQVLREEPLDAPGPPDQLPVLLGELVDAEDRDDVLEVGVALQDPLHLVGDPEVLVADVLRVEDPRRGGERVHRRVDALLGDRAGELGGGVEVRERGGGRRVGVVVGGHVDRLHRGDRSAARRGDPLLQLAHLVGQRGLVPHRGRHAAEQRGDLGARLGEPEDVVDEEQHVLVLLVAEVLRHRERGERDPHAGTRRFVHLTEHQRGVLDDAGLGHLRDEVVALTGALADAREHRGTTEVLGDALDHLLDEHGLAHARAAEQADLAADHVGGEQVEHLDAGLQHLRAALELVERGRLAVDAPQLAGDLQVGVVEALAERVEHVALDLVADRDRERSAEVGDLLAADQAVGGLHGDGAHQVVAEVLGDLQRERALDLADLDGHLERVVQLGDLAPRELDVDDRTGDAHDAAGHRGVDSVVRSGGHQSLPVVTRALAPPTISLISCVIWA